MQPTFRTFRLIAAAVTTMLVTACKGVSCITCVSDIPLYSGPLSAPSASLGTAVTLDNASARPVWSHDGHTLYYVADVANIKAIDLTTSNVHYVAAIVEAGHSAGSGPSIDVFRLSASGERVYYLQTPPDPRSHNDVYRTDATGANRTSLPSTGSTASSWAGAFDISPDEHYLADGESLFDLAAGTRTAFGGGGRTLGFSASGALVAISSEAATAVSIGNVASGTLRDAFYSTAPDSRVLDARWEGEQLQVLYAVDERDATSDSLVTRTLYVWEQRTAASRRLVVFPHHATARPAVRHDNTQFLRNAMWSWSKDGSRIVYLAPQLCQSGTEMTCQNPYLMFNLRADTFAASPTPELIEFGIYSAPDATAVSPDGTKLATVAGSRLFVKVLR